MRKLLNSQIKNTKMSAIREFSQKVQTFDDGIDLTLGQPDFYTPDNVKQEGMQAIDTNKTFYTESAGMKALRQEVSKYYKKYGLYYDWEHEIAITNGAAQALDSTLRTILEDGAEVIVAGPAFPGYQPLIEMNGGRPIFVDTSKNDFKMTADLIAPHLTEKTRCILFSSPSNPVGTCLNQEELAGIAELVKGESIFIVSDEIYSELVYEDSHASMGAFSDIKDQIIVVNGLSKSHSMTGWRVGFLFAPDYLIKEIVKVLLFSTSCVNTISQEAAVEALKGEQNERMKMKASFRERRDYVYGRLSNMGLEVLKPQAAFYIFPSIEKFGLTSLQFANQLLEREHVAVVPGSAFTEVGEHHIRISFSNSNDVLEEGLHRLERFLQTL